MTDKPMILKGLKRIEVYLSEVETSLDIAKDYMQDVLDDVKVSDEVLDFMLDLVDNKDVPEEIRNKAGELWKKI